MMTMYCWTAVEEEAMELKQLFNLIAVVAALCLLSSNHYAQNHPQPPDCNTLVPAKIVTKVRARYTEEARAKNHQGTVFLSVELKSDATIGEIRVVKGLKYGLNDCSIEAARKVTFEPATCDGQPITTQRNFEYVFNVYKKRRWIFF